MLDVDRVRQHSHWFAVGRQSSARDVPLVPGNGNKRVGRGQRRHELLGTEGRRFEHCLSRRSRDRTQLRTAERLLRDGRVREWKLLSGIRAIVHRQFELLRLALHGRDLLPPGRCGVRAGLAVLHGTVWWWLLLLAERVGVRSRRVLSGESVRRRNLLRADFRLLHCLLHVLPGNVRSGEPALLHSRRRKLGAVHGVLQHDMFRRNLRKALQHGGSELLPFGTTRVLLQRLQPGDAPVQLVALGGTNEMPSGAQAGAGEAVVA